MYHPLDALASDHGHVCAGPWFSVQGAKFWTIITLEITILAQNYDPFAKNVDSIPE